jgi:hypothetical protein
MPSHSCWPNFPAIGFALAMAKLMMCICHMGMEAGCVNYVCDWDGDLDIDLADIAQQINCVSEML